MFIRAALTVAVVIPVVLAGVNNGVDPQREVGDVQCLYNERDDKLSMRFASKLNGDPISATFGLTENDVGDIVFTPCTHTTATRFENGVEVTYITVETVIDVNDIANGQHTNPCGFVEVDDATKGPGFKIHLALREREGYFQGVDRDYEYACYTSEATSSYLVASIDVSSPEVEKPDAAQPVVKLEVLRQSSLSGSSSFTVSSSCIIGENLKLRITMTNDEYKEYLTPWGMYMYHTKVARTETASEYSLIVNDNGCTTLNNDFDLLTSWEQDEQTTRAIIVYETGEFVCKRFLNSNFLWFSTYFGTCTGAYAEDERCVDYCRHSTTTGRKRRQANEEIEIFAKIEVVSENDENMEQLSSGLSTPVVVTVVVVAVIILLALAVAAGFLRAVKRRRHSKDSESDQCSDTSSKHPVL